MGFSHKQWRYWRCMATTLGHMGTALGLKRTKEYYWSKKTRCDYREPNNSVNILDFARKYDANKDIGKYQDLKWSDCKTLILGAFGTTHKLLPKMLKDIGTENCIADQYTNSLCKWIWPTTDSIVKIAWLPSFWPGRENTSPVRWLWRKALRDGLVWKDLLFQSTPRQRSLSNNILPQNCWPCTWMRKQNRNH